MFVIRAVARDILSTLIQLRFGLLLRDTELKLVIFPFRRSKDDKLSQLDKSRFTRLELFDRSNEVRSVLLSSKLFR